jgi:hypothetical protein
MRAKRMIKRDHLASCSSKRIDRAGHFNTIRVSLNSAAPSLRRPEETSQFEVNNFRNVGSEWWRRAHPRPSLPA